jgi:hypothetical protein
MGDRVSVFAISSGITSLVLVVVYYVYDLTFSVAGTMQRRMVS